MVDEVGMAVVMDFSDSRSVTVTWAMRGFTDGLDLIATPSASAAAPELEAELDVSRITYWVEVIGSQLKSLTPAWSQPNEITSDPVEESGVRYVPDSLVVFFDMDQARSYAPPGAMPENPHRSQ
jgi:hypothetical protein